MKVSFWNVAGVKNKDEEFWEGLRSWEVVVLIETWVDRKGWEGIKDKWKKGFKWEVQEAKRSRGRGRAKGGMVIGVKEGVDVGKVEKSEEGWMELEVKLGSKWWWVVGVYVNGDLEKKTDMMAKWMEDEVGKERVVIGGDFNLRTGTGGGMWRDGEEGQEQGGRKSKDRVETKEGKRWCRFLKERGWGILNGAVRGDEEGEWTYVGGRGRSVIDYVVTGEKAFGEVEKMEVEGKVDSDHMPVVLWVKTGRGVGGGCKRKEGEGKGEWMGRGRWNEEGVRKFKEEYGEWRWGEEDVEEGWREFSGRIKKAVKKAGEGERRDQRSGWWDEECREGKERLRKELNEWRRDGKNEARYKEEKRRYRRTCEGKKKEEAKRWEMEVKGIRTEGQAWEIINRGRKRRKGLNKSIKMEEWDSYFRGVLGGVEERRVGDTSRHAGEDREGQLSKQEVWKVVKELKDGKATGEDGVPSEVWRYGGDGVKESLWKMCWKVWEGEGWPEGWKQGIVVPVVKKGSGERVEEYRGVTLTQTAYKVYAGVLRNRLKEEVEERGMLPPSQAGFREGLGTLDNIYTLNYLINREIRRKKSNLVLLFVDLKAAFDSVDRVKLVESMRGRGVSEGLLERCEEVLRETIGRVRVGEKCGEKFWTVKGVRQGCPLSPLLFVLLLADLDEELARGCWGGVELDGGGKVYSLAYADDLVLLARGEEEMKGMMGKFERYVEGKGLVVNTEKTKVMRCRIGGGRKRRVKWWWRGKEIEEVTKYRYLGYVVKANGDQDDHVEERVEKAAKVMGGVWGIGKRKFGDDWGRRLWLFDRLVWPVMSYGVEVWGWVGREAVERLHERYLRWVLGVSRRVPGYQVREELQRDTLEGRAGMRAWGYERKLEEGRGGELARRCRAEMKRRARVGRDNEGWEEERRKFYEGKGWKAEEVERKWEEGEMRGEEMVRKEKKRQEEERWKKVVEARGNREYKFVKGRGVPGYLKKGWGERRWQRMARFRLGEEMRGTRFWGTEEERRCRVCGMEEETWEHVWEACTDWGRERGWQEVRDEVLGDEGGGEIWLEKIERWRQKGGERQGEEVADQRGEVEGEGGKAREGGSHGAAETEVKGWMDVREEGWMDE